MKRYITLITILALITILPQIKMNGRTTAVADGNTYSRILTEETAFYADSNGKNFKFYLPYSYYVKIISVGNSFTKISYGYENVSYPVLTGYIRNVDVNEVDTIPQNPYAKVTLCVISDGVLFADKTLFTPKLGVYADSLVYYYGNALSDTGVELYYVYYDGMFGYMRKDSFSSLGISPHPDPIYTDVFEESSVIIESETTKPNSTDSDTNMQIIIIAGISVVAVSLVYLLFRPTSSRSNDVKYDTSDDG